MTAKTPTTVEILDQLTIKLYEDGTIPRPSDNAVSKELGLSRTMISRYRNKGETFSDETAAAVGKLLEWPPEYVVACAHAERANRAKHKDMYKLWQGMAKQFGTAAAVVFLVFNLNVNPALYNAQLIDSAAYSDISMSAVCILCKIVIILLFTFKYLKSPFRV